MGESGTDEAALQRSRSGRRWMALTLVFLSLGGLWLWLDRGRSSTARGAATIDAPATRAADGDERPRASSGVREETRSEDTAATTPASDAPPAASNDELRAALRRLAQTDMQASCALAAALRPLLVPPANVFAVLELLKAGGLGGGAMISLEEIGALRCLVLAALVFNPPPGVQSTLAAEGIVVDGRELVLAILRALPDVLPPVQEYLADMLGGQLDERGQPILDASYAPELERLAAAFPEHAELFNRLLAGLLEALDPEQAAALQSLYVSDTSSPVLVAAGLTRWLEGNASSALAWAQELYDRAETSDEMRNAIAGAIAQAAPVEEAATFLGQRATRMMFHNFLTVGDRAGGMEALDERYWSLRIAGDANELARTMLISGMTSASTESLLAIAYEDPSPDVRCQAWTTLTAAKTFAPNQALLDRLTQAWHDRHDPALVVPTAGIVSAASNFAMRTSQGSALRERAVDILRNIVRDPSTSATDRGSVLQRLERYVSREEYLQLSRNP